MCYALNVRVILQKDTEERRRAFLEKAIPPPPTRNKRFGMRVHGEFPDFSIDDWHCACGYVSDSHIAPEVVSLLAGWLRRPEVKRLEILWYWNEAPDVPAEERLDITELESRSESLDLKAGVRYRVGDREKWRVNTTAASS